MVLKTMSVMKHKDRQYMNYSCLHQQNEYISLDNTILLLLPSSYLHSPDQHSCFPCAIHPQNATHPHLILRVPQLLLPAQTPLYDQQL